jgi:hypothetical protein
VITGRAIKSSVTVYYEANYIFFRLIYEAMYIIMRLIYEAMYIIFRFLNIIISIYIQVCTSLNVLVFLGISFQFFCKIIKFMNIFLVIKHINNQTYIYMKIKYE